MKILLLGGGGREHAFSWKIKQSPICDTLFIAPGNPGTALCGHNIDLNILDFESISQFAIAKNIDMIVVGPEEPLVKGIYDFLSQNPQTNHIKVIGPSQDAAQLEGSKDFAKAFMEEFGIPTAAYQTFTAKDVNEGLRYIAKQTPPIVLKADGLAAGKGVLICESIGEAQVEFKAMLGGKFGQASQKVVVESFLKGIECSVFVLTNGTDYKILPIAKDYKRIGEGDQGLNTGGMGAVSPPPFVDPNLLNKIEEKVIKPTIHGIQKRGLVYNGFIFLGLIIVKGEPFVIEYNCRMGDPETEAVLPRLQNDLVALMDGLYNGQLNDIDIKEDERAATTIMLVSGGYPMAYEKGKKISGIDEITDSLVFQAGTKSDGDNILTNGGRVIAITSLGKSVQEALALANQNAGKIDFDKKYFRKDIGFDL